MRAISVLLRLSEQTESELERCRKTVESLLLQKYLTWECIVINETQRDRPLQVADDSGEIRWIRIRKKNRAGAFNEGIKAANGDLILLVDASRGNVIFRLSSLEIFAMVAGRNPEVGMIYADYALLGEDGITETIHLLDYHRGRVRDNLDLGPVWCIPKRIMEDVGGLDEGFDSADLYDLRLKIAEKHDLVHIQAATNGAPTLLEATAASHNVFDYLMADKRAQEEMESALTEHLKRCGAYLKAGSGFREVRYTESEEKQYEQCIASIVIPVFDRKEFIGTAIRSVQEQTVQNIEVIIVCNGGPDDATIEGVKPYLEGGEQYDPSKPAVRLLIEDVNNIGFCLNRGIQEARGKYYVQLDSDDRLKPDAVEKIIRVFESDARIGMVIGSYEVWEKNEQTGVIHRMEEIPVVKHEEWTETNGRNNLLRVNGAGAPRAIHIHIVRSLGGFGMNDGPFSRNYGEDYDMVLRISEQYRIGRIWEPIYDVIRHTGGTDHSIDQQSIDRNDNAKDAMRYDAIRRRISMNRSTE